jgi:hypothetical protein
MVLIVDDLVTTGATMRRSSEATRAAGVAAFRGRGEWYVINVFNVERGPVWEASHVFHVNHVVRGAVAADAV